MFAIPNKVVIGSVDSPLLIFTNEEILNVTEETGTSAVGDELFIDQFVPIVKYALWIQYIILPKDTDKYKGILTKEGKVLCSKYNYDIRNIPYGTPVRFYTNDKLSGLYYCDSVSRESKFGFKIDCVSAIGMMGKQRHQGGVYVGKRFDAVLGEIIGVDYEYEVDPDVAEIPVYGWLPYSTKRSNLHQLLIAYGVTITKSDSRIMLFTFVNALDFADIPEERILTDGTVEYGEPASRIEIIEHSYHYLSSVEYEVLFDTQGEDVNSTIVVFDHPIYADSLTTETDDTLTITSKGTNYAVVNGAGILKGKPYIHNTKLITKDNPNATTEKIVTVDDATLITMANSDNCLLRLSEYYFNATVVSESIIQEEEVTGKRYRIENPFREPISGFLTHMLTTISSFKQSQCEFIANYMPSASGTSFSAMTILNPTDIEQQWNIPSIVFKKNSPHIRCVLIGKGSSGEDGTNGENGDVGDDGGLGGLGGKGGKGGRGGKILSATIDCSNLAFIKYKRSGADTILLVADDIYTSANGNTSKTGWIEMYTGAVYAQAGVDGIDGAAGGKGGRNPAIGASSKKAEAGKNIEYNETTYKGGKGGKYDNINGGTVGISSNLTIKLGGTGGGGAAYGADGHDGGTGGWKRDSNGNFVIGSNGGLVQDIGGEGADASLPVATLEGYGNGGNGGHGGGGGGGGTVSDWWNHVYSTLISVILHQGGAGGAGSAGTSGNDGCLIIYY